MLGHLRRRRTQRSSATPILPFGLQAASAHLLRSGSSEMAEHRLRRHASHLD